MRAGTGVGRKFAFSSLAVALGFAISLAGTSQANADPTAVGLGAAQSFAVVAHTTVTNTGPSIISGDLGLTSGTSVTGFPAGVMATGNIHINDGPAIAARAALNTAYTDAANTTLPAPIAVGDLAGQVLVGGLYKGDAITNSGTLTLSGDASSVWIFQASSTLITSAGSQIVLEPGVNPCNVFWQVTSSATLGTSSSMVGTVMALTSISAKTGATVNGRLLAYNGAVTLDTNTITVPAACAGTIQPGGTKTSSSPSPSPSPVVTPERPKLAETGVNAAPYIFGAVTLIGGGVVLLMISGAKSRRRRGGRLSE